MRILISPGTVFRSLSGNVQNMVARRLKGWMNNEKTYLPQDAIMLLDDKEQSYLIEAYCVDFDKENPRSQDQFLISAPQPNFKKLFAAADKLKADDCAIQAAIWRGMDISYEDIHHRFPLKADDARNPTEILRYMDMIKDAELPPSGSVRLPLLDEKPSPAGTDGRSLRQTHTEIPPAADAEAQYKLGQLYEKGEEKAKDYAQAVECYKKAAELGHLPAQCRLGVMYEKGRGVEQNYQDAFFWLTKAANSGYAEAQGRLGDMCAKGEGVRGRAFVEAYAWFNIAATSRYPGAAERRESLEQNMTSEEVAEAQKLSRAFLSSRRATGGGSGGGAKPERRLDESEKPSQKGNSWTNSLGMKFVPVTGTKVLFSIWETRIQDFEAFSKATGHEMGNRMLTLEGGKGAEREGHNWRNPGFKQGPDHPVVGVSWEDAMVFCKWLTEKELREGRLGSNQEYRLPTDEEWSRAVRSGKYPWGDRWPPPSGAGNYAGSEARDADWPSDWITIEGYSDGYRQTSPVGSFSANVYGLYDMGGNVWEWCMDWYRKEMNTQQLREKNLLVEKDAGGRTYRVLRGGSWGDRSPEDLAASYRAFDSPSIRNGISGFRCVLVSP